MNVKRSGNSHTSKPHSREGNDTPLQYSCLENPMGRGGWKAAVHGVTKSWTWLSDFTFAFMHWRRKWQPNPMFLPGESQGQWSLVGFHLWGCTESDTTEVTQQQQQQQVSITFIFFEINSWGYWQKDCFLFTQEVSKLEFITSIIYSRSYNQARPYGAFPGYPLPDCCL